MMYNIKDRAAKNCDNNADFKVCIDTKNTDDDGNKLPGGVVFVSYLLGGKWLPAGNSPYGNGCETFKADIGTDIKLVPAPAPGFKCIIGRSTTLKMGKKTIEKKFVFECINC